MTTMKRHQLASHRNKCNRAALYLYDEPTHVNELLLVYHVSIKHSLMHRHGTHKATELCSIKKLEAREGIVPFIFTIYRPGASLTVHLGSTHFSCGDIIIVNKCQSNLQKQEITASFY